MLLNCGVGEDSLRVPWVARRFHSKGNQSWIVTGMTDLKLKLQYFGHLMRSTDSFEKILMLVKIEGRGEGDDRGWDGWMASPTQWICVWVNSRSWWWTGRPGMLQSMGSQRVGHDGVNELNWTHTQLLEAGPQPLIDWLMGGQDHSGFLPSGRMSFMIMVCSPELPVAISPNPCCLNFFWLLDKSVTQERKTPTI